MSGVKGQGRGNGSALRHGGKSLLALVQRATDDAHPVLQIIAERARGYMLDRGGIDALGAMEQDTLRHGATLAILADLLVHRVLNDQGRARRMNAARFKELCLSYSRLAEAHGRVLGLVGLERRAKDVPSLDDYLAARYGNTSGDRAEEPEGDAAAE